MVKSLFNIPAVIFLLPAPPLSWELHSVCLYLLPVCSEFAVCVCRLNL